MTLPTIHLNGTHPEELADGYITAMRAVSAALCAVSSTAPNGRDYYPAGEDANRKARAEHSARLDRLEAVRAELETLAVHCQDEADAGVGAG